jgi:hypothetical protein
MAGPNIMRTVTRDGEHVRSVESTCSSCTYWHGFAWTIADACAQGERHLINVHNIARRRDEPAGMD